MSEGKKPSRLYYLFAVIISIGGCVASVTQGIGDVQNTVESMPRFVMPGEVSLELKAGKYTGYHERQSIVDGHVYASDALSGLRCALRSASGDAVPLEASSVNSSYTLGSYAGTSVFELKVTSAGRHQLTCAYADGQASQPVVVAIGSGLMGSILRMLLPLLLSLTLGVAIFIVVYVKRRSRPSPPVAAGTA
jgi:hypothetical protein